MGTIFGIKIKLLNIFTSFVPYTVLCLQVLDVEICRSPYNNVSFDIILLYKSFFNNITACITVTYLVLKLLLIIFRKFNLFTLRCKQYQTYCTYLCDEKNTYDIIIINIDDHPIRFSHCYISYIYVCIPTRKNIIYSQLKPKSVRSIFFLLLFKYKITHIYNIYIAVIFYNIIIHIRLLHIVAMRQKIAITNKT